MKKPVKFCTVCLKENRMEVKECRCGFKFSPPPSYKQMRKALSKSIGARP